MACRRCIKQGSKRAHGTHFPTSCLYGNFNFSFIFQLFSYICVRPGRDIRLSVLKFTIRNFSSAVPRVPLLCSPMLPTSTSHQRAITTRKQPAADFSNWTRRTRYRGELWRPPSILNPTTTTTVLYAAFFYFYLLLFLNTSSHHKATITTAEKV